MKYRAIEIKTVIIIVGGLNYKGKHKANEWYQGSLMWQLACTAVQCRNEQISQNPRRFMHMQLLSQEKIAAYYM